jgi:hypothetical protein
MKIKKIRFLLILIIVFTFLAALPVYAAGPTNYTYVYSFWWDEIATPDAYYVGATIRGGDFNMEKICTEDCFGSCTDECDEDCEELHPSDCPEYVNVGNFRTPQGIHIRNNFIYVCDTGNNRIAVIEYITETDSYNFVKELSSVLICGCNGVCAGQYPVDCTNRCKTECDEDCHTEHDEDCKLEHTDECPEDCEDGICDDICQGPCEGGHIAFCDSPLNSPHDIFVDRMCFVCARYAVPGVPLEECGRNCGRGEIFIADSGNLRILRLDKDYNFINDVKIDIYNPPPAYEDDLDFIPRKLVVDFSGRIFVQALNVNRGFMEFNRQGDFISYMGASRVQIDLVDIFWRMVATDAMRARMALVVPTEYSNIALDHDGFIYATISTFQGPPRNADPVRRLNAVGTDILVRNGRWYQGAVGVAPPHGDWYWSNLGGFDGPSRFTDVVPFDNDSYACLDRNRSRVFVYDFQGNMLYAFGGPGNRDGYFRNAVAIDRMERDLFVLDDANGMLTRFRLTEYGTLINQALDYYYSGDYDSSAERWDEVLKLNGNFDLAYIGKGRAALRNDEFYSAMNYYRTKYDQEQYGRAFQLYRKYWIEEHIVHIIVVIISLIVITKVLGFIIRRRRRSRGGYEE